MGNHECDSKAACASHSEMTFSDIRSDFSRISKTLTSDCAPSDALTKLLKEFLRDPDIRASWDNFEASAAEKNPSLNSS